MDLLVRWQEVVDFMQNLCSSRRGHPCGAHRAHWDAEQVGRYENDCSVARLAENRYMLMSPSIQQMRSYLAQETLAKEVVLQDVTSCTQHYVSSWTIFQGSYVTLDTRQLGQQVLPILSPEVLRHCLRPDILLGSTHTGNWDMSYIPK